ncbi:protein of unknown function (plasmid) [Cupriavidus taiwanensis]|uniref:Uncharacterized protein n=1 Tax=Cupriavidus taiwanensis TaxID=164546 RepID=A0A976FYS8_9BURK|nr:exported hypothetical protein [Cupriavidus taiwanensis]SPD66769.1 protein of unknown function [Cupriavidus taiwanensis]
MRSNRLAMVGPLSSAASRPLPGCARASTVACSSLDVSMTLLRAGDISASISPKRRSRKGVGDKWRAPMVAARTLRGVCARRTPRAGRHNLPGRLWDNRGFAHGAAQEVDRTGMPGPLFPRPASYRDTSKARPCPHTVPKPPPPAATWRGRARCGAPPA